MRGRKPEALNVVVEDMAVLQRIAYSRWLPWFQVERARVVLAMAAGQRTGVVAARLGCGRTTVWRICRCYEQGGVAALLGEAPRCGRPPLIFPPAAGPDRPIGLSGAPCPRFTYHALDQW